MASNEKYSINDLPKYSPWPARLLGLEPFDSKVRTLDDIEREYGHDKWGALLERAKHADKPLTVDDVDVWFNEGTPEFLISIKDKLEPSTQIDACNKYYFNIVYDTLVKHAPASALVELGAGYGSVLFHLSRREPFSSMPLMAGDYTDSGLELMKLIAETHKVKLEVAHCDFTHPNLTDLPIPEDAIIYTSFAAKCVPNLPDSFVESLVKFRPKVVVNFEPCYHHYDQDSLLGFLRRKYVEVNDYNRNFIPLLKKYEKKGLIKILSEETNIFGVNALLPASIIAWSPA